MKKLLLLVGLVVFLTPMVVSAETVFKSDLPKCKIKKNEIKSKKPCYGKIVYPSSVIYEGEFGKFNGIFRYHGKGTHILSDGTKYEGLWKNGQRHGEGIETSSNGVIKSGEWRFGVLEDEEVIKKEDEEVVKKSFLCQRSNGTVFKSSIGCTTNKAINLEEYEKLSMEGESEKLILKRIFKKTAGSSLINKFKKRFDKCKENTDSKEFEKCIAKLIKLQSNLNNAVIVQKLVEKNSNQCSSNCGGGNNQQAQQQQNNSDFNLLNKNQMQFARPSDWGGHGQRIYQQSGWTSGIQPSDSGLR